MIGLDIFETSSKLTSSYELSLLFNQILHKQACKILQN
jgi:hypothetical protein